MSDIETYTLSEERRRQQVMHGGISATHVVRYSTFPAAKHPGRWTRRAYDRVTLCGSLRACVVGGDASDWAEDYQPIDISAVTCDRCRNRYEAWAARAQLAAQSAAEEGRRLASERDDLIAAGADPADLQVPIHPEDA